jgi:GAF domain-containing protein
MTQNIAFARRTTRGQAVQDPTRLSVLRQLALLDSPAEEAFDRLTRLATRLVDTPVSLVSLVDADRQFFKSFFGLGEPWATARETGLSHSFCQHVVTTGEPLIITDARQNPLVADNLAIPDLNVIGYLGMPLTTSDGYELGSFCVIDTKPREWTEDEIAIVRDLSASALAIIELRGNLMDLHAQAVSKLEALSDQIAAERARVNAAVAAGEAKARSGATGAEVAAAVAEAAKRA